MKLMILSGLDTNSRLRRVATALVVVLSMFAFVALPCAANGEKVPDAAQPGELVREMPTLKCLGVRWLIGGDANANARIALSYRPLGAAALFKRSLLLYGLGGLIVPFVGIKAIDLLLHTLAF